MHLPALFDTASSSSPLCLAITPSKSNRYRASNHLSALATTCPNRRHPRGNPSPRDYSSQSPPRPIGPNKSLAITTASIAPCVNSSDAMPVDPTVDLLANCGLHHWF
ncbi:hypothetical protein BD410DRAFT_786241 [Rickenella mellea]|uniref:Uncharacterized protein n=1 Tax=Rickenella mellea TaxID=50990 RepID=A0A4Y7Q921_9AGAM|nr:hypothetical protein BD410DRAFT_786241 [Rickenella mellea]